MKQTVVILTALFLLSSCLTTENTAAPQEETAPVVEQVSQSGVIFSDDFNGSSNGWNLYAGDKYGCAADLSISNGEATVNVTKAGNETHGIQFRRSGFALNNGKEYSIKFSAKVETERTIEVQFCKDSSPYTAYSDTFELLLTPEMTDYSLDFAMMEASDDSARLRFKLGVTGEGSVTIDNFSLEQI